MKMTDEEILDLQLQCVDYLEKYLQQKMLDEDIEDDDIEVETDENNGKTPFEIMQLFPNAEKIDETAYIDEDDDQLVKCIEYQVEEAKMIFEFKHSRCIATYISPTEPYLKAKIDYLHEIKRIILGELISKRVTMKELFNFKMLTYVKRLEKSRMY